MRYVRLILLFIKTSLQNEMAYRANFFINILNTALGLLGSIGGVLILYANRKSLNGWSFIETMVLLGVYMTVQASKDLFIGPSLDKLAGLGGEIESGNFDFTLLRPMPVQFYISVREWSLWSIFNMAVGIGIMGFSVYQLNLVYKPLNIILFIISLINSQVIIYSIMIILSSVAFWYRGTFLLWIWGDIFQTGRYPVSIYPGLAKLVLTWIIPVGIIVTVPAEIIIGKADYYMFAGGILLAGVFFIMASAFFKRSLKKYTSASS